MRALGFLGLSSAIALSAAGSPVAADSGRPAASMSVGTAAPVAHGGWGGVPNAPLRPPMQPGWGANGWHGGAPGGPVAGMPGPGPGGPPPHGPGPGGPPPGGMGPGGPGPMGPGGPGPMGPGGPAGHGRPGTWHGGYGWQGGGYGWHGQYRRVGPGHRLPRYWVSRDYYVSDWGRYGLWQPGYGQNWIRYYDDALLIDGSGRVIDGRYGLDWNRGNYDYGYGYDEGFGDGGYDYRHGGYGHGPYHQGGVTIHRGPGTTVVVVQGQPTVTTTTTTTYEEVGYPRRHWKPRKPACRCR